MRRLLAPPRQPSPARRGEVGERGPPSAQPSELEVQKWRGMRCKEQRLYGESEPASQRPATRPLGQFMHGRQRQHDDPARCETDGDLGETQRAGIAQERQQRHWRRDRRQR